MILKLDDLVARLQMTADRTDTLPSEALWIELAPERDRHHKSVDYRTPDSNTLVRIYLDATDCIVGIEIFP